MNKIVAILTSKFFQVPMLIAAIMAVVVVLVEVRTWRLQEQLEECRTKKCQEIIGSNFGFTEIADELAYLRELNKLTDAKMALYYNQTLFNYETVQARRRALAHFIDRKHSRDILARQQQVEGAEQVIRSSDTLSFKQGTKYQIPADVQLEVTKLQNARDEGRVEQAAPQQTVEAKQ